MLFLGQEFLESGWLQDTIPLVLDLNQEFAASSTLYRDLIHLRLNLKGNTRGLTAQGSTTIGPMREKVSSPFGAMDQGGPGMTWW